MAARKRQMNFEGAVLRLEEIVQKMEDEELSLEESIEIFKEGMELVLFCNKKLDEAERKISIIAKDSEGKIIEDNFDPQEE